MPGAKPRARRLVAVPITPEAYAPYGRVIREGDEAGAALVNQGTARRFDRIAEIANLRPGSAHLNLATFRCQPRALPLAIRVLEKHPASTQVFVPMNVRRYVVVVALGGDRPDPATLAAFHVPGSVGVTYAPGTWHHSLVALDATALFACLVWEDDTAGDCVESAWPDGDPVDVA